MHTPDWLPVSMLVAGLVAGCSNTGAGTPSSAATTTLTSDSGSGTGSEPVSSSGATGQGSTGGVSGSASGTGSGTSTGSGGSTGGGARGSSGGSTGASGGGTCDAGDITMFFNVCPCGDECTAPDSCVNDPTARLVGIPADRICEPACQSNDDCDDLDTACLAGHCGYVGCGGSSGNGTYSSTCSMSNGDVDGTCIVSRQPIAPDSGLALGFCAQAGTQTSSCDPYASSRSQAAGLCQPGSICEAGKPVDGGYLSYCDQLCDGTPANACPAGQFCFVYPVPPVSGLCEDAG